MKVLVGKNTEQTATTLPRSCMTDSAISSVSGLSDDTVSTDVATTPTCILTPLLPGATREGATVSECESGVDVGCLQVSLSTVESCGGCAEGSGNAEAILAELESVSVEWRSLRKARTCPCAAHFEHFTRKYHCWRCGRIYCSRCIDKRLHLLGHFSNRAVPVCRNCYKQAQSTL
ncbi:PREDICTED: lateral signaling target protein 2 homolog [Priapulus caudatus]|uniref:Lateral signaling target protein 2 homolog n=1 Tax=Priapulus caudatus TaxID=37621 RepID=A0ABM1E9F6_PRICU|nr:PREDICTED: lateral signaling target protein 2 homolog [Priapulus caudatus]